MVSENGAGKNWQELLADARHMMDILAQETCEGHIATEVLGQCVECFRLAVDALAGLMQEPRSAALQSEISPLCDLLHSVLGRYQLPETVNQELRWLRAANRSLTLDKNRYHNIFSATTNLVLIADYEGRITRTNPEAERCFPRRSAIGRFFWNLLDLQGANLEQVLAKYRQGESHEILLFNGSRCYGLRILSFSPALSGVRGYILILNDITVLVDQAQELETLVSERTQALSNSEQMLRHIFNSAGNGIMLVDESCTIVQANQRAGKIYGLFNQQLVGLDVRNLTDQAGRDELAACFSGLGALPGKIGEIAGLRSDGSVLPTSITVTQASIDDRCFWILIVRDISRQKALESRLILEKTQVEEMNVTLRNVMKSIDDERRQFEEKIARKIRVDLLPVLEKADQERELGVRSSYLGLVREQLIGLTKGFETELDAGLLKLSRTELAVCRFIQAGSTTKEICDALNLAFETVQTHRKNIRSKLGLKGKKVNLHAFLASRCQSLLPSL